MIACMPVVFRDRYISTMAACAGQVASVIDETATASSTFDIFGTTVMDGKIYVYREERPVAPPEGPSNRHERRKQLAMMRGRRGR